MFKEFAVQPSLFQQAIFDFQDTATGNAVVNAVAGSGKSTTLRMLAEKLSPMEQSSAVFVAFNKHIVDELKPKLPPDVYCATVHSMGCSALRKALKPEAMDKWVNSYKYERLSLLWLKYNGISNEIEYFEQKEIAAFLADIVRLTQLTLADGSESSIRHIMTHFSLVPPNAIWQINAGDTHTLTGIIASAIDTLLKWGYAGAPLNDRYGCNYKADTCISYDDMIWMPVALSLDMPKYDFVYVDESQDLNACQTELILRMAHGSTRYIFVGDRRQAIYGFAGADTESIDKIIERTQATELPLSICYRCPSSHVQLASRYVPEILARDNAPEGVLDYIDQADTAMHTEPGDMYLCRFNAPLVAQAFSLISKGIAARVRGKDIGQNLIGIVDQVEKMPFYEWQCFPRLLEEWLAAQSSRLAAKEDNELQIAALQDRAEALSILWARVSATGGANASASDLKSTIKDMFSDEHSIVTLSSIHKAKGLEADRIMILEPDNLPYPGAKTPWQREQEKNLAYVGWTRSRDRMYFVTNTEDLGLALEG